MVSNGEYMPIGQTDKQKEVEARLAALSAQAAKRLGMSRRRFLTTTGGFAASFIAVNQVFGEFFDVRPIEMLMRSEEHTSELQSQSNIVCRLLLDKKKATAFALLH